jgi:hypothetical protein
MRSPLEAAVARAVPYLAGGLVVTPILLLVPVGKDTFLVSVAHLSLLVALGIALAAALAPLVDEEWFTGLSWGPAGRRLAGGIALVVIATGVVGLVTLASSAALRLQPSLQFLQLLSALDIAWAAGAVVVGGQRLWSRRTMVGAGLLVGVACVFSIWNYLRVVGFAADGGWLLDGGELMRLVLPFDMVAAIVAGSVLFLGTRKP